MVFVSLGVKLTVAVALNVGVVVTKKMPWSAADVATNGNTSVPCKTIIDVLVGVFVGV